MTSSQDYLAQPTKPGFLLIQRISMKTLIQGSGVSWVIFLDFIHGQIPAVEVAGAKRPTNYLHA